MDDINTLIGDFPILDFEDIAVNVNEAEDLLDNLLHEKQGNYDKIASQKAAQDINQDLTEEDI